MTHPFVPSRFHLPRAALVLATIFTSGLNARAEPLAFTITEVAGLRRFGYPVSAALEAPSGVLANADKVRLLDATGEEVPAQFTAMSQWPDGSVRALDVDFESSLGPLESRSFRVEACTRPQPALPKGLSVAETDDEITVASAAISHRIRRDGKPLLASIAFGQQEFLAADGITTTLAPGPVRVLKRGPFNVTLQLGEVRLEYVSSKSWVRITQRAKAPTDLAVNAHFALTRSPLMWDFGVGSWLYGTLGKPGQSARLRQGPADWQVLTGDGAEPSSLYATGKSCEGWGHLADANRVAAFGVADYDAVGEPNFHLSADGHVRTTARRSELTVYFHVVGQPVQVNAVTSPPSMLSPLRVKQQVKPAASPASSADTTPKEDRGKGTASVKARRLKVSPNGRYFVDQDDKPFFYLADTGWEILHRLTREEAEQYLDNRATKGFTVIMVMGLTEYGGLDIPNRDGHLPLVDNDPARPNEAYFKHVDDIIDLAAARGLCVALLPTWGDKVSKAWGKGPEIFNVTNARVYGEFLGKRYKDKPVFWILGGDRSPVGYEAIWRSLAEGLAAGDQGAHLMSYHGADDKVGRGSSPFFHNDAWLGFNMTYSGHAWSSPGYEQIARDRALTPVKPTLDSEPNYENHPYLADGRPYHQHPNEWDGTRGDAHQMRLAAYWAMLAGAAGHTYGCHDIWQFYEEGREPINHANTGWRKAMDFDGAKQMGLLRKLFEARPWYKLVPDPSLIAAGQGEGAGHVQAARAEEGSFVLAYLPRGGSVTIQMNKLSGRTIAAHWFDPREGTWTRIGEYPNTSTREFTTPSRGPTSDWVLVLDDKSKGYAAPAADKGEEDSEVSLNASSPWPTVFELDRGQSVTLRSEGGTTTVKLLEFEHETEPNYWPEIPSDATIDRARVAVEVNGRRAELLCRPYEMPKSLGGVRLYVETTKTWAETPQLSGIQGVRREVRFSAVAEGKSWGPDTLAFPVADYRWRSSTYQNTWNSLVPFNVAVYYHRGEDLGAIPNRLDQRAILDGRVVASPLPKGDGKSNGLIVDVGQGMTFRYAHMNIEHVSPRVTNGAPVARGQTVGKTGNTWGGRPQVDDGPHVHLELRHGAAGGLFKPADSPGPAEPFKKSDDYTDVSFFPSLVEAYFRDYDDVLLPIAGGYGFVLAGGEYTLDGTRSLARPGRRITSYRWRLHDGRELDGPLQQVKYTEPGFFAEELIVRADDGSEERDAIHVRVYEPRKDDKIALGWLHYTPARAIRPGTEVTFWNRLKNVGDSARIDFGDGSPSQPIGRELRHAYREAGLYTVALSAKGAEGEPALLKVRLRVIPAG